MSLVLLPSFIYELARQTFKKFDQNASQSQNVICTILPFIGLIAHTPVKRTLWPPPSSHNIHLIPCHGLRPRRALITSPCPIKTIGDERAAFRHMNNVGLRDDEYFVHIIDCLIVLSFHHDLFA